MKLPSLTLVLALLPAALFAGGNSASGPTVIPAGTYTTAYVISAPGSYVFAGNRTSTGSVNAIEITAPDVTLDLNGFALDQTNSAKDGIYVPAPENVEIRNGSILHASSGVRTGVGKGLRLSNLRLVGTTSEAVTSLAAGAQIDHCRMDDCAVKAIWAGGTGSLVTDCVVNGGANSWGVNIYPGGRVIRTVVRGTKVGFYVSGTAENCIASDCSSAGFWVADGTLRDVEAVNNGQVGIVTNGGVNYISGSRITGNPLPVNGPYFNGGSNLVQ